MPRMLGWPPGTYQHQQLCQPLQMGAPCILAVHSRVSQLLWQRFLAIAGGPTRAHQRKQRHMRGLVSVGTHTLLELHSRLRRLLWTRTKRTFCTGQRRELCGLVPVGARSFLAIQPSVQQLLWKSSCNTKQRQFTPQRHEWNLRELVQMGPIWILALHSELPWMLRVTGAWARDSHASAWSWLRQLVSVRAGAIAALHT